MAEAAPTNSYSYVFKDCGRRELTVTVSSGPRLIERQRARGVEYGKRMVPEGRRARSRRHSNSDFFQIQTGC